MIVNIERIPVPPLEIGRSLIAFERLAIIPDLVSAVFMARNIIDWHSFSVKVQVGRDYFSFAEILEYKVFHASSLEEIPDLNLDPHPIAVFLFFNNSILVFIWSSPYS